MSAWLMALTLSVAGRSPEVLYKRAVDAFDRTEFKRAAELLSQALDLNTGTPQERATRKLLVLALYNSNQIEASVDAYRALMAHVPDFAFDEGEVLPETIEFFERRVPRPRVAPASQPRIVQQPREPPPPPASRWRWHFLAPLGIGQFTAGSPIRGALFAALEVGFIATNVAGYVVYSQQITPDGLALNAARARTGILITNLAFAGILTSVVAAAVDAIFFEP